jgi:asparagine synthase (glutamine-hydrolysing)
LCGIVAIVNWADGHTLAHMTAIQNHRGPDDHGIWEKALPDGGYIGLGNCRLAILDLSEAGHMPMGNESGTIWITYNGEVYNFIDLRQELIAKGHAFRSNTDTEVILHLYEEEGPDCVKKLNGMFSFAICDLRGASAILFLARDHFGIKPLYYTNRGHRFACASEVKALLQLPGLQAEIDLEALHQYLTFLWVPDPKTMFKGIEKLEAGHYAIFKNGILSITEYWDITYPPAGTEYLLDEKEILLQVRERFRNAVRRQMISDVPIGAFLSGGIDSSSIVAMMAQLDGEPVQTYTVTFPRKYRRGETTLDDPRVASAVAKRFGSHHREIVVEPEVTELLPRLVWHMDEPVADPAIITAYLICREARRTVTVLLSGVGGDELFAGYRKYCAHYWAKVYRRLPRLLRQEIIEPAVGRVPAFRGTAFKGFVRLIKKMIRSGSLSPRDAFLMNSTYFDEAQKGMFYTQRIISELHGRDPWQQHSKYFERVAHADFLNQMLYLDTKAFMASLNLTYNDKMSMASSVEVRVPFLDWEFAEFVARNVPPHLKLKGFLHPTTKYIFRKAMQGILPKETLSKPKAGFGAPVDYWLAEDLREMVEDLLGESDLRKRGLFRPKAVRRLIEEQRAGREDWSLQIWQLLTLELWMQTFVDR